MTGIYNQSGINYSSPGSTYSALAIQPGTYNYAYETYNETGKVYNRSAVSASGSNTSNPSVTRTNLIQNPNFEVDTSTWVGYNSATIARTTSYQYFGTASLLITSSATSYNGASMGLNRVPITAGKTYYLSAYVRNISGDTRSIYIGVQWFDSSGVYISEINSFPYGTLSTAAGWVRRYIRGTAPANAASANIFIASGTTGLTAGWQTAADGVLFEESSTLLSYFDGDYATGYGLVNKSWTGQANASISTATWNQGRTRTNLFPDPSMENASIGTYWQAVSITESRSTDYVYSGTYSMKGVIDATATQYFQVLQTSTVMIDVSVGETYTFSAYIYLPASNTADSTWRADLYFWNGTNYTLNAGVSTTVTRGNWTRLTVTGTVPAGYLKALPRIIKTGTSLAVGQIAYVDAWLLETGPDLLPYFDGSNIDAHTDYAVADQRWMDFPNASTSTIAYLPVAHKVTQLRLDKLTDFSFGFTGGGGSFYIGFATVKKTATGSGQGSESAVRKIIRVRTATGSGSGGSNNSIVHGVLRTGYGSGGATAGDQGVGLHISPRTATASGSGTSSTVSNPVRFRTATGNGNGAGAAIGLRTVIAEATGSGLGTDTVTYIHVVVHIGIGSGTSSSSATALRITFASATGSGASNSSTISLEIMGRAATSAGTGSSAIVVLRVVPRTSSSQGIGGSSAVRLIVSPRTGTGAGAGAQTSVGARVVRVLSVGSGDGSSTAIWVKSHILRMPATDEYPAGLFAMPDVANRFRSYDRSGRRAQNLYKLTDGTYTTTEQRDEGQVEKVYLGSHNNFLTDDEVSELTAAGYGSYIT